MADQKIVLALVGRGANDAIRGMIDDYADALRSVSLSVLQVTLDPAELRHAYQQMQAGKVAFALTWLGIGQDLAAEVGGKTRNVWEAAGIPLLKLHGDHPAYFSARHNDVPRNSVNFYVADEFIAYRRKWMRGARALTGLLPPMPLAPISKDRVHLKARRNGRLVFLKNGNDPVALRALWRERLPFGVAKLMNDMAEASIDGGLRGGRFDLGDFVAAFLDDRGIQAESALYFMPFLTAQLDDYLRRVKSAMITTALLDFPVVVQGGHWDHIDFSGRRARLVPGEDFAQSNRIFTDELGVIDMSPNLDSGPHERVMRAAGAYGLVLTNQQGWIHDAFGAFDELMFDFNPESIAARVEAVLARPDHYLETALAFGDRFRERFPREAVGDSMVDMAELAVLQWSPEKPVIQPFFVWPELEAVQRLG